MGFYSFDAKKAKIPQARVTEAARIFFPIRPITSLICDVVNDNVVVVVKMANRPLTLPN